MSQYRLRRQVGQGLNHLECEMIPSADADGNEPDKMSQYRLRKQVG